MALNDIDGKPIGLIFPGQGSQAVGMGKELYAQSEPARAMFDLADETLGFSLSELCFEGPAETLEDTYNAQPALLAMSIAALADLKARAEAAGVELNPVVTAGHSLGEFTALVAARALDFVSALELVRERGRLMKQAGEASPGGMAAIIGMEENDLETVVDDASHGGMIRIANANCPGQIVISGEIPALEQAMNIAKERGARKVMRLGVSIASHSPLMEHASRSLLQHLDNVEITDPQIPVIANASAQPITTAKGIREELAHHMERPVNWTASVETMISMGASTFVELGPGMVLGGLIRRIDRNVTTVTLDNLQ